MILSIPVSFFPTTFVTQPATIALGDFLRSTGHIGLVEAVRAETDKAKRTELKKGLPCATISGTFRKREVSGLLEYNGLLCIDFDEADNPGQSPEEIKVTLAEFDEVAYAATSVGGKGVFAIIQTNNTDPKQHSRLCDFMRTAFLGASLVSDPSCKDISRLRYASYDPEAHYNEHAGIFDAKKYLAQVIEAERLKIKNAPSVTTSSERTRNSVEAYLELQASHRRDVTTPYQNWLRVGFALIQEFGSEGETYFHRASQFHPDYDYHKTAAKYASMLKSGASRAFIGTFFKVYHEQGIRL